MKSQSAPLLFLTLTIPSIQVAHAVDATAAPVQFPKFPENGIAVSIDGKLDEAVWADVPAFDNMVVIDPDTLKQSQFETHSRFFYTDKGLYVGISSQQDADTLIARLSSRDQFINRDGFEFTLD